MSNGNQKQINDDNVKLNVVELVNNEWKVKKEFESTFGYLNNPVENTRESGGRSDKTKYSRQDMEANLINKLIEEAGL